MKIVVWGAHNGGVLALDMLCEGVEVVAFIDSDTNKQNTYFKNVIIVSPEEISKLEFDYIIIANQHSKNIIPVLTEQYQVPYNKIIDFFNFFLFDPRIGTLRRIANEIKNRNIPGAVAELGVYKGDFAKYINECFPEKKLYLFDTFSGFDERDISVEQINNFSPAKVSDLSCDDIEYVINKMKYRENCIMKKGYFPETAVGLEEEFCFVSIDVDLFNPIYEGLNYFYDRLSKSGYIMIHDYYNMYYTGTKSAVQKFIEERNLFVVPVMDSGGSAIICK